MKTVILILIVLVCTHACGGKISAVHAAIEEDPPISPPCCEPPATPIEFQHYIMIGNSLMEGSPPNLTTPALMLMEENKPATNISSCGQTMIAANADNVAGTINYLSGHGRNKENIAVLVQLAHNDWYGSNGLDNFKADYHEFLDAIEDDGLQNVYVFCIEPIAARWDYEHTVNNLGESYQDVRDAVRAVAETGKCTLIDTGDWFTADDVYNPDIMPDGLHLIAPGHRIYKDRLMEVLNSFEVPPLEEPSLSRE